MSHPALPRPLLTVAAASLAGLAFAQAPTLQARSFFHDDYRTVIALDMKAVRDTGIWDELTTSSAKMVAQMIERSTGFELDRLDRVTSVRARHVFASGAARFTDVTAIEGNGDLGEPEVVTSGRYEAEEVGAHTLYNSPWADGEGVVGVNDRLRIYGPTDILRDVLSGHPRAGLPSPDVMSFTAGQKGVLFYFVVDLQGEDAPRNMLRDALADVEWPEGDAPTFACGRLCATGDEDDPHVLLELVLRHEAAGDGLAATARGVAAALDRLKEMQQARLFRPVLDRIEHERDGMDAIWRVDVGRAREFGGLLGSLAPFLLFASAEAAPVAAPAVNKAVEKAPVAEPGKKNDERR